MKLRISIDICVRGCYLLLLDFVTTDTIMSVEDDVCFLRQNTSWTLNFDRILVRKRLSFHTCKFNGSFIGSSPYCLWATCFHSCSGCYTFCLNRLDDTGHYNVAHTPVHQYRLNYYRHNGLRACRVFHRAFVS